MCYLDISCSSGTKPDRVIQVSCVALDITVIFALLAFILLTVYFTKNSTFFTFLQKMVRKQNNSQASISASRSQKGPKDCF